MERCCSGACSTSLRIPVPKAKQVGRRLGSVGIRAPAEVRPTASARVSATSPAVEDQTEQYILSNGTVDYYAVLQVDDDADAAAIKASYRNLAKVCHPDFLGDAGHNICILLNEAYDILMNPIARQAYDAQLEVALRDQEDGYTGEILSKWIPTTHPHKAKNEAPDESRAVFVDELSCIGCKMCVWCASATFRVDPDYGRSRVFAQWLDTEDKLQQSIDSCPVDCIHWVDKSELPALEYVVRHKTSRVNVAQIMVGGGREDIFGLTRQFLKERRQLEEERRKASRQSSPLQEEARRKAAQEISKHRSNWFGDFGAHLFESLRGTSNSASANGRAASNRRVGQRKRTFRQPPQTSRSTSGGGGGGGTIPAERALLPASRVEDV